MFSLIAAIFSAAISSAAISDVQPGPGQKIYSYPSAGLARVRVSNLKGNITIVPMELVSVRITLNKITFPENCTFTAEKTSNLEDLIVQVRGPSVDKCEADIELQLPSDVALDIDNKAGNINITGNDNSLKYFLAAGTLKVNGGKMKRIEGRSGAGIIEVKNFAGNAKIEMGAGSIDIAYTSAPALGAIDIQSGTGTVNLSFPKGAKLKSELQSGIGISQNDFANDFGPNPYSVAVKTGAGNIRVKTY